MTLSAELDLATTFLKSRSPERPTLGLVLGSGLSDFAGALQSPLAIPFPEIPGFPASTVSGHRGEAVFGRVGGIPVIVLAGRAHAYEGHSQARVAFPTRVLARLGVRALILTNAAGGINKDFEPGDLMAIEDHLNLTGGNPCVGPNDETVGPRFFDMSSVYDVRLREVARKACLEAGITLRSGVYAAFLGPSYETPAEVRMARLLGADAVGMSTVPEAIAARHMGLRVLGLSCITNVAAGLSPQRLDHREVLEAGARAGETLQKVLPKILAGAASA